VPLGLSGMGMNQKEDENFPWILGAEESTHRILIWIDMV
jgi:hypothetical protein